MHDAIHRRDPRPKTVTGQKCRDIDAADEAGRKAVSS